MNPKVQRNLKHTPYDKCRPGDIKASYFKETTYWEGKLDFQLHVTIFIDAFLLMFIQYMCNK